MIEINTEEIRRIAASKTYINGVSLQHRNKVYQVTTDEVETGLYHISGDVEGSSDNEYHTWIDYSEAKGEIVDYECECPAFYSYPGLCKHCVALAMEFAVEKKSKTLEQFRWVSSKDKVGNKEIVTDVGLANVINDFSREGISRYVEPDYSGVVELEPILHYDYKGWCLTFKVGREHKYVMKDIITFMDHIDRGDKVEYGKKLSFIHEMHVFTPAAQELIEFIRRQIISYCFYYSGQSGYYTTFMPAMKELRLSKEALCEFYHIMCSKSIKVDDYRKNKTFVDIVPEDPQLKVSLEVIESGKGYCLIWPEMESVYGGGRLYVNQGDTVYECTREFSEHMKRLCALGKTGVSNQIIINKREMRSFCSTLLPVMQKYTELSVEGNVEEFLPRNAVIKLYFDWDRGNITVRAEADYGEAVFNLLKPVRAADAYRDLEKEYKAIYAVKSYFTRQGDMEFYIEEQEDDKIYHLLSTGMAQLASVGEIYVSEAFKKLRVTKAAKVSVGISVKGSILDLDIDGGGLSAKELQGYLESYRLKRKYYRLKNGDFIELEGSGMSVLSELSDGLGLKADKISKGRVEVPKNKAFYLDQVLKEAGDGTEVLRDTTFKAMIRTMRDVEDSDFEIPPSLKRILRNYQKTGFRWLCTLEKLGFGGILADDMGLGKTLQVIAFLLYDKQTRKSDKKPSLIVCPASLVYNWESEMEKFAPTLSVLAVAGANTERRQQLASYEKYDVLVTSYDLLKRDLDYYQDLKFFSVILDEAQNIKNHETQAAKAVKALNGDNRFALTGTPIENRLSEIWSIFDFLMPNMLGSYQKFKKEYEGPIVQNQDETVRGRFLKILKPFILRRMKTDVLKDLPDKEENVIYSKLDGEQASLYQANAKKLVESLNKVSNEAFQSEKLQILAEITRLRQLCCAPSLVYENYKGGSAKLDTCMELIKNAMEGGHKILVFSQFTSLLELLERELHHQKIIYYKLTGSTSKPERSRLTKEFNENAVPVFLISLKAGGTGLNLTGASIVIHFDPWWNVAAQNQATDRAHRIGQTNTVSVFKLIAKNTIEEKILKLQEAKKDLSDQIISQEGISVAGFTKEDFMEIISSTI